MLPAIMKGVRLKAIDVTGTDADSAS